MTAATASHNVSRFAERRFHSTDAG